MRQSKWFPIILSGLVTMSGCSWFNNNDSSSSNSSTEFNGTRIDNCQGNPNFIIVDGQCVPVTDVLSDTIHIDSDGTVEVYDTQIELLDDFVADLSGSVGLAVVPEDYLESANETVHQRSDLALWADLDTTLDTQNVIVKLTEDGFFEAVDFQDGSGAMVDITANPLALEVFGDYTLVVFEVNTPNTQDEFTQKVYNAFYSGGVYVIHNPSGKMFATRDVTYIANTYSYTQDLSRNVTITVTLGEPVVEIQKVPRLDEFGQPMFDENNNQIMDDVEYPLMDENGDPLIITEGPFLTEWVTEQKIEYFSVPRVDENGDPVLDPVTNEQIIDIVEQPVIDENGDPVMISHEAVVVDEEGNPVQQTTFDMEFFIQEVKEITETHYSTLLEDNALTPLAQKFMDRLMAKYYNWYYAKSQNYVISNWGFAMGLGEIYFMQQVLNAQNDPEQIIKKLGFDEVTNELTIENYLNVTKAGLEGAEIILDADTNNIFALFHNVSTNMKIYSPVDGLYTLPDTDDFSAVTFPNGDLYFHRNRTDFVEELGYATIILYDIDANGDMTSKPIKLASYQMKSSYENGDNVGVYLYDDEGTQYTTMMDWIPLANEIGDPLLSTAELHFDSISAFTSDRLAYDWDMASYEVKFHILDENGDEFTNFTSYIMVDEGDPVPPYDMWYQMDTTTLTQYAYVPSTTTKVCTNAEYGCVNHFYLSDPYVAEYGITIYDSRTIAYQDPYIQSINVLPDNAGVYSYSKTITSATCEFTTCDEQVRFDYYDLAGDLLYSQYNMFHLEQGDPIPLIVEYRMSELTVVEEEASVCNSSTGCWRNYMTPDNYYFSILYEAGDTVYSTITFDPSDQVLITEQTVESTVCINPDGCSAALPTTYTIRNTSNEILYQFEQQQWVNYGYRVPFDVELVYDPLGDSDVEIVYQLEYSSEQLYCTEDECEQMVSFQLPTLDEYNYQPWGYVELPFASGDPIWSTIIFDAVAEPVQINTQSYCKDDKGCTYYVEDYVILDEFDNPVAISPDYHPYLPIQFDLGDLLPTSDFTVTFRLENVHYEMNQLNPYPVLNSWSESLVLDENTYLFPPTSPNWEQTPYVNNIVLTYDPILDEYSVGYTNLEGFYEIVRSGDEYYTINDEKTGIYKYVYDDVLSHDGFYYFAETYLTEGLAINAANDLIVDFDGTIYFRGVDNFIQDMTGVISVDGTITIDTVYTEHEIIRLTPVN